MILFRLLNEECSNSWFIRAAGLFLFSGNFLTEKGKPFLRYYWFSLLGAFISVSLIVVVVYFGIPEFREEVDTIFSLSIRPNV